MGETFRLGAELAGAHAPDREASVVGSTQREVCEVIVLPDTQEGLSLGTQEENVALLEEGDLLTLCSREPCCAVWKIVSGLCAAT